MLSALAALSPAADAAAYAAAARRPKEGLVAADADAASRLQPPLLSGTAAAHLLLLTEHYRAVQLSRVDQRRGPKEGPKPQVCCCHSHRCEGKAGVRRKAEDHFSHVVC